MADDTETTTTKPKTASRKRTTAKKDSSSSSSSSSSGGGSKVNEILSAIVDHITRHGSEADDAFNAKVHELSGGKVGRVAKGTTDENSPENQ